MAERKLTERLRKSDTVIKPKTLKKTSMFREVMRRLFKNNKSLIGLILFGLLVFCAAFAPLLTPYGFNEMDIANMYAAPSASHLFGTDELGRDILTRLMYGARQSLGLGLAGAVGAAIIGLAIGVLIGYIGGAVDIFAMRIIDIWSAIPSMLLAILISTGLGAGYVNTIIAMIIGNIPAYVRIARAMCLKERTMEYIEAERSINCSPIGIMAKHVTPNILAPIIVTTTMKVASVIMQCAGLSYLGLGVQPPAPEWGAMLSAGKNFIQKYPFLLIAPGAAIAIAALSINMIGDGLRDSLDPKLKD